MIEPKNRTKILEANLANIVRKVKAGKPLTKGELHLIGEPAATPAPNQEAGLPVYDSQAACAAATKIPAVTIRLAARSGCPGFKSGRVSLAPLLEWIFTRNETEDGIDWSSALREAQTKRERLKLSKERGEVVDHGDACQQAADAIAFVHGELERLEREMPPILKGLSEMEICAALMKRSADIRARSRSKFDVIGSTPTNA